MLQSDSRKVRIGDTFIALKGIKDDGHNYILDAINNGAKKIICEHGNYPNMVKVDNTNTYLHKYLKDNYLKYINRLKIIGITGTNGKTTTAYLIYQAMNNLGIKCAYIGTIGFYINGKIKDNINTTPDILTLYHMLTKCVKEKVKYVVMEVSSQGLYYNRVDGLKFDYAVFTNLTIEHLDFHKNMDNYLKEKMKLFSNLKEDGISIINSDDQYYKNFITDKCITYGVLGDYKIRNINYNIDNSSFTVNNIKYKTSLIGEYNIYNLCVVIIILKQLGISDDKIYNTILKLDSAPGRMDKIKYNDSIIIIDYAHSPDAVEKVLKTLKDKGRITTIIGCGGNRDKSKRKIMGSIASKNSDYVIFTSDNPRYEESEDIIIDMIQNVDSFNYEIEINRENAIIKGIQRLEKNDILLILGKGHENYQEIKGVKYPFNDKDVVLKNI